MRNHPLAVEKDDLNPVSIRLLTLQSLVLGQTTVVSLNSGLFRHTSMSSTASYPLFHENQPIRCRERQVSSPSRQPKCSLLLSAHSCPDVRIRRQAAVPHGIATGDSPNTELAGKLRGCVVLPLAIH